MLLLLVRYEPTKEDFQVLNVVKDADVDIDPEDLPMVSQWFNGMMCCGRGFPTRRYGFCLCIVFLNYFFGSIVGYLR